MGLSNFPNGISSFGVPVLGGIGGLPFTGNWWFVDPVNGLDGNQGNSPDQALQSLYRAHLLAGNGTNDVVVLIGNGQSSGTARLSKAAAQAVNPAATNGTLNWTKNALHLIGVCAPSIYAQRARIAPPTGTYTQATFGSGNFVVVTGSGCLFSNFSLFHGFSTGGTNQICWTDSGSRNAYINVAFGGMGDATSAADAGSRSLKIGLAGSGENYFKNCSIGLDTVARSAANASIEFAGATPRNTFEDCLLPMDTSASSPLFVLGTGADCVDRGNIFKRCAFINDIKSGSTAVSVVLSLTNAAPGGLIGFLGSASVGATKWGDTNGLANSYIDMAAVSAAAGGLGLNPS
jgi:hypothetical protein